MLSKTLTAIICYSQMDNNIPPKPVHLGEAKLREFFIDHLNRIYCAKTHVVKRFREVAGLAHFKDIFHALNETADDVEKQIFRMQMIYSLMDTKYREGICSGMTGMLDEALVAIYEEDSDTALRDMAILFYLQNIEGIEAASFQVLQIVSRKLKNTDVQQLIRENFDEAKEDRALLLMITARYIAS